MLHLDAAPHYGSAWAGLTLDQLLAFAQQHGSDKVSSSMGSWHGSAYSHVELHCGDIAAVGPSREYSIDLAPKVSCWSCSMTEADSSPLHPRAEVEVQLEVQWRCRDL